MLLSSNNIDLYIPGRNWAFDFACTGYHHNHCPTGFTRSDDRRHSVRPEQIEEETDILY